MSVITMRIAGLALAAFVVIASGVALTRSGWPFGTGLLTIHKLVALAAVVYLGVLTFGITRTGTLATGEWVLLVAGLVLTAAAFASGGVVSAVETAPASVVWIHRIGSWIALFAVGALARLVIG